MEERRYPPTVAKLQRAQRTGLRVRPGGWPLFCGWLALGSMLLEPQDRGAEWLAFQSQVWLAVQEPTRVQLLGPAVQGLAWQWLGLPCLVLVAGILGGSLVPGQGRAARSGVAGRWWLAQLRALVGGVGLVGWAAWWWCQEGMGVDPDPYGVLLGLWGAAFGAMGLLLPLDLWLSWRAQRRALRMTELERRRDAQEQRPFRPKPAPLLRKPSGRC